MSTDTPPEINSRWELLALAAMFGAIGLFFAFQLFVVWGFATMVNPDFVGFERTQAILSAIFSSVEATVWVWGFGFLATLGLSNSVMFFVTAMRARPSMQEWMPRSTRMCAIVTTVVIAALVLVMVV